MAVSSFYKAEAQGTNYYRFRVYLLQVFPPKKGFLIGLAEVCCWSWLGGIVLLDDLRLGCHSLVLGVGADITS